MVILSEDRERHLSEVHGLGRLGASLREIVYGGNDGIVTTFAVVAGFAGAAVEGAGPVGAVAVLLFGLANLFADATSMGLGAYLSARSQRDMYRRLRASERRSIATDPEGERAEVITLLAERGVTGRDAEAFADLYARHPELLADFMMRHEMRMPDPDDGSPAVDAAMTFASFVLFGAIPLVPWFLLPAGYGTFLVSVGATAAALVALGLLRWRLTRETIARCVGETVAVGATCAAVAYAVGLAFR